MIEIRNRGKFLGFCKLWKEFGFFFKNDEKLMVDFKEGREII